MGRKSVKENKNYYQLAREEVGLSRETAAEKLFTDKNKIERIENRGQVPDTSLVLTMAEVYKEPLLCNYYCNHDCEIGDKYAHNIQIKDKNLSEIVLDLKFTLKDYLKKQKNFEEIARDNKVEYGETEAFVKIQNDLRKISFLSETLLFWTEEMVAEGKIDKNLYKKLTEK